MKEWREKIVDFWGIGSFCYERKSRKMEEGEELNMKLFPWGICVELWKASVGGVGISRYSPYFPPAPTPNPSTPFVFQLLGYCEIDHDIYVSKDLYSTIDHDFYVSNILMLLRETSADSKCWIDLEQLTFKIFSKIKTSKKILTTLVFRVCKRKN